MNVRKNKDHVYICDMRKKKNNYCNRTQEILSSDSYCIVFTRDKKEKRRKLLSSDKIDEKIKSTYLYIYIYI